MKLCLECKVMKLCLELKVIQLRAFDYKVIHVHTASMFNFENHNCWIFFIPWALKLSMYSIQNCRCITFPKRFQFYHWKNIEINKISKSNDVAQLDGWSNRSIIDVMKNLSKRRCVHWRIHMHTLVMNF